MNHEEWGLPRVPEGVTPTGRPLLGVVHGSGGGPGPEPGRNIEGDGDIVDRDGDYTKGTRSGMTSGG